MYLIYVHWNYKKCLMPARKKIKSAEDNKLDRERAKVFNDLFD
jgi:hypothetical protein